MSSCSHVVTVLKQCCSSFPTPCSRMERVLKEHTGTLVCRARLLLIRSVLTLTLKFAIFEFTSSSVFVIWMPRIRSRRLARETYNLLIHFCAAFFALPQVSRLRRWPWFLFSMRKLYMHHQARNVTAVTVGSVNTNATKMAAVRRK